MATTIYRIHVHQVKNDRLQDRFISRQPQYNYGIHVHQVKNDQLQDRFTSWQPQYMEYMYIK